MASSDLYEHYRQLRETDPVTGNPGGPWRVARYQDVHDVLRDHETFSSRISRRQLEHDMPPSLLFSDPPLHSRLRRLVARAFSPRHISDQRELVEQRCEELVSHMSGQDQPDLIAELAVPLPVTVISHMLGVADGDIGEFKRWSDTIFGNIGEILLGSPSKEVEQAAAEMDAYFLERIERLRKHAEPHLLSHLVYVETDSGRLTDEELLSFCRLLLIAGNETTTGLIVACVRVFDEFPETFTQLKHDQELVPTFVEETLRYYAPFQLTIRRATRDVELAGVEIEKGDLVLPLMASANRDDEVFDRPDEFVIDRDPNPHLAFGYGIHNCLAATLARMEGQIIVASLVKHLDGISLAAWDPRSVGELRGPSTLAINIRPAAA
ncbi:MAG: cytochrome P450 [Pseudomonadales bacterium]